MRGLGIFIMRSLMDDICFTKNQSGMCVRLTKFGLPSLPTADLAQTNGRQTAGPRLGAVHDRLKALFEFARLHSGSRRQH
jgi:hypothetical protein